MRIETICILGGSGFVGRHIAAKLARRDKAIRVLTRRRERNRHLLVIPNLQLEEADIHDEDVLAEQFQGCDAVINLVGILNQFKPGEFQQVHVELPQKIASACQRNGVKRLLHMSALGADAKAPSEYLRTKAEGERLVLESSSAAMAATTFRPSVIFGPEDSFFNRFAALLKVSPLIVPLPTPQARFKPVFVGDVAEAFIRCFADRETFGRGFELCGPDVFTLRQIVEYTAKLSGERRLIWGLGDGLSRLQAKVLERLPGKPYSMDNYLSSTVNSVCAEDGLAELGLHATAVDTVVPGYLGDRSARRRYTHYRRLARRF